MAEDAIAADVFQGLQRATAKKPEELVELFRDYLDEAQHTLAELRRAVAAKQAGDLRERAHFLKGASQVIGARAMSQCCATLEQMGRSSDLTGVETALQQTEAALVAVETDIVKKLGPAALPAQGPAGGQTIPQG